MLFALLTQAEERMLGEWAYQLGLRGWTAEEACEASEWLSINDPPVNRSQHLKVLEKRLPVVRQKKIKILQPPTDPLGTCVHCRGDGVISVPSRRFDKVNREWRMPDPLNGNHWYSMQVACFCALGRWKQQHSFGEKGIMDIGEYEALNPDWREEMDAHNKYLRVSVANQKNASDIDSALGLLQKRVKILGAS